uniref:Uncharacterized protein n=1 Tax=Peronospora matthiolae TaxID=2874970 RepID=A0AAV1UN42_9STRA
MFWTAGTIIRRVRDFTKYINGSPQRLQNLRKVADVVAADVTAKKLVQDVSTRWNSTWAVLKRAFLLREVIGAYIYSGSELRKHALEEHEWALVHEVIKLLEPFEEATVLLTSAKHPSIMAAAPAYSMLLERIQATIRSCEGAVLESSIRAMMKKLQAYKEKADGQYVYKLATVLDPRIKLNFFEDSNEDI